MNILITGDYCPQLRLDNAIQTQQPNEILGDDFMGLLERADLAITNLECPVTNSEKPIKKTGPNLKTGTHSVEFLRKVGFNLVTLANNHIMDYGVKGLEDTLQCLDNVGLEYVGVGTNIQQKVRAFRFAKDGVSVSVLNFTENEWIRLNSEDAGANEVDLISNYRSIQDEKMASDRVIVISHGGHELYPLPSPEVKKRYRFYIDAGADAVIGHHPHCISGYEVYNDSPIFYSVGNFLFDHSEYRNSIWNEGMAVNLNITSETVRFDLIHFSQCKQEPVLKTFDSEKNKQRNKEIDRLNAIIQDDERLKLEFEKWVHNRERNYRAYMEPHKNRFIYALQSRGLFPSFWTKRKRSYLLNIIRCESHREILLNILEDDHSHT